MNPNNLSARTNLIVWIKRVLWPEGNLPAGITDQVDDEQAAEVCRHLEERLKTYPGLEIAIEPRMRGLRAIITHEGVKYSGGGETREWAVLAAGYHALRALALGKSAGKPA